jgi:hypothetical protein
MKIPHQILVRDQVYEIKFVDRIRGVKRGRGKCCLERQTIWIKRGQSESDQIVTFFHEMLHAIEFEYEIDIAHDLVYALEGPLAQVIVDNLAG